MRKGIRSQVVLAKKYRFLEEKYIFQETKYSVETFYIVPNCSEKSENCSKLY